MPTSLEARRLAVSDALRAVMRERPAARVTTPAPGLTQPGISPQLTMAIALKPIEERLDSMSGRLTAVVARLDAVQAQVSDLAAKTSELAAVERDAVVGEDPVVSGAPFADDPYDEDRVSVPAVALDEVRMSSVASRALFGG